MTRRSLFGIFFLAMASAIGSFSLGATSAIASEKAYFVDILYLKEGKTPEDAKAYFDKVLPIIAKHGLLRAAPGFVITKKMSGDIDPNLVNVWSVSDQENTFSNIFADPAYLENVPLRDTTFDMSRSHMFMLKATE
ncbi:MAG: hypothetical protein IMF05_14395 [Proteobacteria bacterium]|nr:hypothetical protein [Pseudomonadota bacterium]